MPLLLRSWTTQRVAKIASTRVTKLQWSPFVSLCHSQPLCGAALFGRVGNPVGIVAVTRQYGRMHTKLSIKLPTSPRAVAGLKNLHHNADVGGSSSGGIPVLGDTIYALSTAPGRAAIAVIRVSGPAAREVYGALCPDTPLPNPRHAAVRTLFHPLGKDYEEGGGVLDSGALVLYFPAPRTVTGEDVLELHVHGGRATVNAVLSAIPLCDRKGRKGLFLSGASLDGDDGTPRFVPPAIRYAEPGEFTKRAFFNDRLDLAQIDSLGETLAAETEQQRRAAERGNSRHLSDRYESWRDKLLLARAEIEALIDFSEDQHFDESPSELLGNVARMVGEMLASIRLHELGSGRGRLLRSGIRIALLGPPNAGKSSLMNLVVGREASIVSPEAGTTRDVVEVSLDLKGFLCSFADTAGFRGEDGGGMVEGGSTATDHVGLLGGTAAVGAVEREGIRRARAAAMSADVVVALGSVELSGSGDFRILYDMETIRLAASNDKPFVVAINKRDVVDGKRLAAMVSDFRHEIMAALPSLNSAPLPILLSCKEANGQMQAPIAANVDPDPGGIHGLTERIVDIFRGMTSMPTEMEDLLGVTERQRQLLVACREHLEDFAAEASRRDGVDADVVLAAEHLRVAANALARITGRGDVPDIEDVLGVIFEK